MAEKGNQNDLDPLDRNAEDDLVGRANDDEFDEMEDLGRGRRRERHQ